MGPETALPLSGEFTNTDDYVEALLQFVSSSSLLQLLCGGVHILDFFTRTPDLYGWLLESEWRNWFHLHEIPDILDFVLREDMAQFSPTSDVSNLWRGKTFPPQSLVEYIRTIRDLSLRRDFEPRNFIGRGGVSHTTIPHHVAVGMKVKKIHEVDHFARYVQKLTADLAVTKDYDISHVVDFGSGQNYLGRTLASKPYSKHVIAVESKPHNIEGAKAMDIHAKIAPKHGILRNKKIYRAQQESLNQSSSDSEASIVDMASLRSPMVAEAIASDLTILERPQTPVRARLDTTSAGNGTIQYVEHRLQDGNLSAVIDEIVDEVESEDDASGENREESSEIPKGEASVIAVKARNPSLMVMSIHSCGNLSHHGLRSLILNPTVSAVAIVGCCYNLVTERLTPPSYKHPSLRPKNQVPYRPWYQAPAPSDPHGFPMSSRIMNYHTPILLNITSRMMAVQAPQNWGPTDSNDFFTRHFYRALLQKVFLDRGIVEIPRNTDGVKESYDDYVLGGSKPSDGATQPIVIGSLRKSCYISFVAYVHGVLEKLLKDPERGAFFQEKLGDITDVEIQRYADDFGPRQKDLSVVWTLMAYSAGLVEAVIVVDRWLWLTEQRDVGEAWVEAVFDYQQSPRNLVVVGIKE